MTWVAAALVLAFVGMLAIGAVHDLGRRALAGQVRMAELRVEGMQRADYAAAMARFAEVEAMAKKTREELGSFETAVALGRQKR